MFDGEAIRGAIRENLEGSVTGVRQIAIDEISGDITGEPSDIMKARRAIEIPRFWMRIDEISPQSDSPMGFNNVTLWSVNLTVRCAYNLQGPAVDHVDYNDRKAVAEEHAIKFAQRLIVPGSVTTCVSLARSTGIVSGKLTPRDGFYRVANDEPEKALFEVEHAYSAVVRVDAATA